MDDGLGWHGMVMAWGSDGMGGMVCDGMGGMAWGWHGWDCMGVGWGSDGVSVDPSGQMHPP